jgi:hypothetical protein
MVCEGVVHLSKRTKQNCLIFGLNFEGGCFFIIAVVVGLVNNETDCCFVRYRFVFCL